MTEDTLLDDDLKVIREQSAQRMPAEIVETMEKSIDEIEAMTIGRALDVGAQAPDFELRPQREPLPGAGGRAGGALVLPGRVVTVLQHRAAGSAATP